MKKILLNFFLLFIIAIFSSCSSGTSAGGQVNPNGSVTVKYEIILSSPLIPITPTAPTPQILYNNSTAQREFANDFNYGSSTWTKTFNLTASRPCLASLTCNGLYMNTSGTVTANIYINGVVKATQTNPTQGSSGIYGAIVELNYAIY